MPRRRQTDPSVQWCIPITESVATAVDARLIDPVRGKARYASRGQLVTALLRQWLNDLETPETLDDQRTEQRSVP